MIKKNPQYKFNLKTLTIGEFVEIGERASTSAMRDKVFLLKMAMRYEDHSNEDELRAESVENIDVVIAQFVSAVNEAARQHNKVDDDE